MNDPGSQKFREIPCLYQYIFALSTRNFRFDRLLPRFETPFSAIALLKRRPGHMTRNRTTVPRWNSITSSISNSFHFELVVQKPKSNHGSPLSNLYPYILVPQNFEHYWKIPGPRKAI